MKGTIENLKYFDGHLENTILKGVHNNIDFTIGFNEGNGDFEVDGYEFTKSELKLLEDALREFILEDTLQSEHEEEKRQKEIDYWEGRNYNNFADRGIRESDFF